MQPPQASSKIATRICVFFCFPRCCAPSQSGAPQQAVLRLRHGRPGRPGPSGKHLLENSPPVSFSAAFVPIRHLSHFQVFLRLPCDVAQQAPAQGGIRCPGASGALPQARHQYGLQMRLQYESLQPLPDLLLLPTPADPIDVSEVSWPAPGQCVQTVSLFFPISSAPLQLFQRCHAKSVLTAGATCFSVLDQCALHMRDPQQASLERLNLHVCDLVSSPIAAKARGLEAWLTAA
mmetsp:Transcript_74098/g.90964  ORF Transcript_74098/g.90964 Transcript_74098/m.90964 type:complete len:234 (-) Transcript_74098:27-728(-)